MTILTISFVVFAVLMIVGSFAASSVETLG
jgi:hypothetical protein